MSGAVQPRRGVHSALPAPRWDDGRVERSTRPRSALGGPGRRPGTTRDTTILARTPIPCRVRRVLARAGRRIGLRDAHGQRRRSDADADRDAHGDADRDADGDTHGDAHGHADRDAHDHADRDAHGHADPGLVSASASTRRAARARPDSSGNEQPGLGLGATSSAAGKRALRALVRRRQRPGDHRRRGVARPHERDDARGWVNPAALGALAHGGAEGAPGRAAYALYANRPPTTRGPRLHRRGSRARQPAVGAQRVDAPGGDLRRHDHPALRQRRAGLDPGATGKGCATWPVLSTSAATGSGASSSAVRSTKCGSTTGRLRRPRSRPT